MERLALEIRACGLSTREIEEAFREATGDIRLSLTAVSVLIDQLWADYQTFCERDLSVLAVEYLFLDGVYESLRRLAGQSALAMCAAMSEFEQHQLLRLPAELGLLPPATSGEALRRAA